MERTKQLAAAGIFTALVAVVTVLVQIPIPASGGYFNLGESVIYIAALLFGPLVGAFAGGVGSMLADVATGYIAYAPGTLVIKGIEGFLVGYLFVKLKRAGVKAEPASDASRTFLWILIGGFVMAGVTLSLGSSFLPDDLPISVILATGIMFACIIAVTWSRVKLIRLLVPMITGGTVMVVGYLLYGLYVYAFPAVNYQAFSEIIWNVVQVLAGIVAALLVYQPVYKSGFMTGSPEEPVRS